MNMNTVALCTVVAMCLMATLADATCTAQYKRTCAHFPGKCGMFPKFDYGETKLVAEVKNGMCVKNPDGSIKIENYGLPIGLVCPQNLPADGKPQSGMPLMCGCNSGYKCVDGMCKKVCECEKMEEREKKVKEREQNCDRREADYRRKTGGDD